MAGDPQTYTELKAAVARWMKDDTLPTAEMIALSERRLSRNLNTPEMEATTTLSVVSGTATLPTDFMGVKSLSHTYNGLRTNLRAISEDDYVSATTNELTGRPYGYVVRGNALLVRPAPSVTISPILVYKQMIPVLSDTNPTNWLLSKWPDLYLYHSIAMGEFYGWNDPRLPLVKGWADEIIQEIMLAGAKQRYGDGPLRQKSPVKGWH